VAEAAKFIPITPKIDSAIAITITESVTKAVTKEVTKEVTPIQLIIDTSFPDDTSLIELMPQPPFDLVAATDAISILASIPASIIASISEPIESSIIPHNIVSSIVANIESSSTDLVEEKDNKDSSI